MIRSSIAHESVMPNVVSFLHPQRSLNAHPFHPPQGFMFRTPARREFTLAYRTCRESSRTVRPHPSLIRGSLRRESITQVQTDQIITYTKQDPQLPATEVKKPSSLSYRCDETTLHVAASYHIRRNIFVFAYVIHDQTTRPSQTFRSAGRTM